MKTENYDLLINEHTEYFDIRKFYEGNENGLTRVIISPHGTVTEMGAGEAGSWFATYTTRRGSCFSVYREYNRKGCIRKKWVAFRNGGAVVGMRYVFDEQGTLCIRQNEEEHFLFTPHDVIRYCMELGIDLSTEGNHSVERLSDLPAGEFLYLISYTGTYTHRSGNICIVLDGKTGKEKEVILQNTDGSPENLLTSES